MELGAESSVIGADDAVNGSAIGSNGNGVDDDNNNGSNRETSSSQRYDMQRAARWIEQILSFFLLLLVVFVRQHLQGFVVAIYVTTVLFICRSPAIPSHSQR